MASVQAPASRLGTSHEIPHDGPHKEATPRKGLMGEVYNADKGKDGGSGKLAGSYSDQEKVHAVIELMEFEGYWSADEHRRGIFAIIGVKANGPTEKQRQNVWLTVLVIAFLQKEMKTEEELWCMVVEKAEDWLKEESGESVENIEKMREEASALLES